MASRTAPVPGSAGWVPDTDPGALRVLAAERRRHGHARSHPGGRRSPRRASASAWPLGRSGAAGAWAAGTHARVCSSSFKPERTPKTALFWGERVSGCNGLRAGPRVARVLAPFTVMDVRFSEKCALRDSPIDNAHFKVDAKIHQRIKNTRRSFGNLLQLSLHCWIRTSVRLILRALRVFRI